MLDLVYRPIDQWPGDPKVVARFLDKVYVDANECWIWQAWCDKPSGYGRFHLDGRMARAHRVAYQLFVGPIPEGLEVDHLCFVTSCVNPAHLEAVTSHENILRSNNMAARHLRARLCPQGHAFTPDNTKITTEGARRCRTCHRRMNSEYKRRKRAERRAVRLHHPDTGGNADLYRRANEARTILQGAAQ